VSYYGRNVRRLQEARETVSACLFAATIIQAFILLLNLIAGWYFSPALIAYEVVVFFLPLLNHWKEPGNPTLNRDRKHYLVSFVSAALVVWGVIGFIVLFFSPAVFRETPLWVFLRVRLDPEDTFDDNDYYTAVFWVAVSLLVILFIVVKFMYGTAAVVAFRLIYRFPVDAAETGTTRSGVAVQMGGTQRQAAAAAVVVERVDPVILSLALTALLSDDETDLTLGECLICLDPFTSEDKRAETYCACGVNGVAMHSACLDRWRVEKRTCPQCREVLWERGQLEGWVGDESSANEVSGAGEASGGVVARVMF
jgi:hypothetical protein